ncbi:hypothetical protein DERP_003267 [Dermatophagoides pteronyssinus]|uniref:Uncharacterized protein n=1 Tax=Dermatophagoides pteronyssinus TaxID=6956 RepID=A0ABQ8JJK8_DERPT|nr:hypothetical protein DERP_003267 [Dermatophagoides pteronyssinus]
MDCYCHRIWFGNWKRGTPIPCKKRKTEAKWILEFRNFDPKSNDIIMRQQKTSMKSKLRIFFENWKIK